MLNSFTFFNHTTKTALSCSTSHNSAQMSAQHFFSKSRHNLLHHNGVLSHNSDYVQPYGSRHNPLGNYATNIYCTFIFTMLCTYITNCLINNGLKEQSYCAARGIILSTAAAPIFYFIWSDVAQTFILFSAAHFAV